MTRSLVFIILLLSAPCLVLAQTGAGGGAVTTKVGAPANLPTATQVIERYLQATGGREAYLKIKSMQAAGTIKVAAMNDSGSVALYAKAPNKSLVVMNLGRIGEIREGFNGRRGWNQTRQKGVQLSTPAQLTALKRDADFYKYLNLNQHFAKVKLTGVENFYGTEAYVVEATPVGGAYPEKMYFDTRTGLLVRLDVVRTVPEGRAMQSVVYYGDYREVDGLKVPFQIQQTVGNLTFAIKIYDIRSNVTINDAAFDPPASR